MTPTSKSLRNVFVVIRAASERTLPCAKHLAGTVVSGSDLVLVEESPFEEALRKMCDEAIRRGKEWTLVVDADLLVSPIRIGHFVEFARQTHESVFHVQGFILDKLSGVVRNGGPRLYRTRTLSEARSHVPADGESHRPESVDMIEGMHRLGYRSVVAPLVLATHDFDQYYRDIFRKTYAHSIKHPTWIAEVVPFWREEGKLDADFRIALHGMWHGLNSGMRLQTDIRTLPSDIEEILQKEGLREKDELDADAVSADDVEHALANSAAVIEWEQRVAEKQTTSWQRFERKYREMGGLRFAPWAVGWGLQQLGLGIKRIASRR
jgi:hypothetical protein